MNLESLLINSDVLGFLKLFGYQGSDSPIDTSTIALWSDMVSYVLSEPVFVHLGQVAAQKL